MYDLDFKDIFNNDGLYRGESFLNGFYFEVLKGKLLSRQYLQNKKLPKIFDTPTITKNLVNQKFMYIENYKGSYDECNI